MRIKSFAKINLGLEVLGTRLDGYHDILTLFQSIDLADVLDFSATSGPGIDLTGDDPAVSWDAANLVHRAATLLRAETGCSKGARITVAKSIPAGAGLGGGSSNAAMALHGLNALWGLGLDAVALSALGAKLGADVPYFFKGGLCLGEGRGDRLTPVPDLPAAHVLLVFPPFPVGTAEIYAAWRPSLTSGDKPSRIRRFLEIRDPGILENRLEETIFRSYPQLEEYKEFFQSRGAAASLVSGTGSTVFGLFTERGPALEGRRLLRERARTILVETLSAQEYWRRLRAGV